MFLAKVAFIVVFEHVVFSLKALIQHIIPDVTKEVKIAIERQQYIERQELELTIKHARHYEREHSVSIVRTSLSTFEEVSIPITGTALITQPESVAETSVDDIHGRQDNTPSPLQEKAFAPASQKQHSSRQVSIVSHTDAEEASEHNGNERSEAKLEDDTSEV